MNIHKKVMNSDELSKQFLHTVSHGVRSKEMREEIRREVQSHLDELSALKVEEGHPREEAIQWAIEQMGDPQELNYSFKKIHRPILNWKLLVFVLLFAGLGLSTLFSFSISYHDAEGASQVMNSSIFNRQLILSAIGILLCILCYFVDYRKFSRYAWHFYITIVVLEFLLFPFAITVNNEQNYFAIGLITIDYWMISIYAYLIPLASIISRQNWSKVRWNSRPHLFMLMAAVLPVILYFYFHITNWLVLFAYAAAVILMYTMSGGKRIFIIASSAIFLITSLLSIFKNNYTWTRLINVFSFSDANRDYTTLQIIQSIQNANWWGQGWGIRAEHLPFAYSDLIFTYFIYTFGWIAAAIILLIVGGFIAQCLTALHTIRDLNGKLLFMSLFIMLTGQLLYSLGSSFGLLPVTKMYMPFFSYGSASTIISYTALGLMLGIYRRKNWIPINKQPEGRTTN